MTWKWRWKGSSSCSFSLSLLSLFQTPLWHLCATIVMPPHLHLPHQLMMPPLPPSFPQLSTTTHCHHSHACYQLCMSCKWLQMMATQAQMMATHCLGPRYTFFFVSSFYKLTNCNLSFSGSILLVMRGAEVAQPTPTPTCATPPGPPHPNEMWGVSVSLGRSGRSSGTPIR